MRKGNRREKRGIFQKIGRFGSRDEIMMKSRQKNSRYLIITDNQNIPTLIGVTFLIMS